MINSFDDDTHYCLKCHSTITGLDNYVGHRKSKCGKLVPEAQDLLQAETEEPFALKADDFFSSLELQSSSKKISPSSGGKSFSGVLTRSKANAVLQSKDSDPKNENSGEWILNQDKNSDKPYDSEDDYDYSDSEEDSYDDDEEDNRLVPPRSFTGGKWKPTSSPIQWLRPQSSQEEDWNAPPAQHTGGKWKPLSFTKQAYETSPEHCGGKWKPATPKENYHVPPLTFTGGKWASSKVVSKMEPPPEHTKGKWKPQILLGENTTPPPSYTKGKWKPEAHPKTHSLSGKWHSNLSKTEVSPFRKSSGTVQYWCRPCNRRLASKIVYERHLKSELHFKRTLNDSEFDETPYLNITSKRNQGKAPDYCSARTPIKVVEIESNKTQGKTRKKIFVTCDGCNSRVNRQLIGKHLISHYHFRKTDMSEPKSRSMVLENIHSVVLQSPYQCSPCKFYFNTHELFLRHWLSESHQQIPLTPHSFFWCCVCKFQAESSDSMYEHLLSKEHGEIISVFNRSVPVIIKKVCPIKCRDCNLEFKLNIELKKHCEKVEHGLRSLENYQLKCQVEGCDMVVKSRRALQRHQMLRHKEEMYICSVCSATFSSRLEAKRHRLTSEHRCAVLERSQIDTSKQCSHCTKIFPNILKLKEHLKEDHPEQNHSCSKCGKKFLIPQDLTVHLRTKACSFHKSQEEKAKTCEECPFQTDSTSELVFHRVLHTEPLMIYPNESESSKRAPVAHYKCPVCQKCYPKLSLRCHLRMHTNERPFVCSICNASFVRRNNLILHIKNHDKKSLAKPQEEKKTDEGERLFLCSTCGASFKKRSILQQHMTRHTGKLYNCTKAECVFAARSPAELKNHLITHSDEKPFACEICDYRGKSKQQLNRHMTIHEGNKKYRCPHCPFNARLASHLKRHQRIHTGSKPFNCPHCSYSCNNLENLRKHVLLTNKHPGKCIYECKFCQEEKPFDSNFAKDFKVHLMNQHSDQFNSGKEATKYVSGIYGLAKEFSDTTSDRESQNIEDVEKTLSQLHKSSTLGSMESAVLLAQEEHHKISEELFPMFIVSNDEHPSELWNIGGNYDVDESGSLVPFHSELSEHFQ